jgi:monovalent cation:H+ antiporter-2, CPA2 family
MVISPMHDPAQQAHRAHVAPARARARGVWPRPPSRTSRTEALARREHVILCGYGRVGQNVARVLDDRGLRVPWRWISTRSACATALEAGDRRDLRRRRGRKCVLKSAGLDRANAVVVTFSDTGAIRSPSCKRNAAPPRRSCPSWCGPRTTRISSELLAAGATEVVPGDPRGGADARVERAAHARRFRPSRVIKTVGEIRRQRYKPAAFSVFRRDPAGPRAIDTDTRCARR